MSRVGRIALLVVIAVALVWVLFTVVFPWVDATFVTDPVLESSASAQVEGYRRALGPH